MSELIFRTEELTNNQIADLYVASEYEQSIIDKLKAPSPVLLIGSRGCIWSGSTRLQNGAGRR